MYEKYKIFEYLNEDNMTLDLLSEEIDEAYKCDNQEDLDNKVCKSVNYWMDDLIEELWKFRNVTRHTKDENDFIVNADLGTYAKINDVFYFKVKSNDINGNEPMVLTFNGNDWKIN
ncbi:MAG: hypothetical protein J5767_12520 [Paludibacteraceae bacterium]|nr:hypothetical protein [Paludibacteraceae bacterium]